MAPTLDPKYDNYDYPYVPKTPASGHLGSLTAQQEAAVHQLRGMLEQAGFSQRLDTLTLLRFLRARKFDTNLAKQMFVDNENWRSTFQGGVDNLVQNFHYTDAEKKGIAALYPQYYHKTDKDGRPVYIEQLGKIDITALNKITTQDRMLSNLVVEYEKVADPRLPACSRKAGGLLETCCTIMDLSKVSLWNAKSVYGYLQSASSVSQDHYPERLGHLYIINAPFGFSTVFSVVKGFLDPVTVQKIHVLGSGYKKELLDQIPAENLPVQFGGKCNCPGGCMFSDEGPWQDANYLKGGQAQQGVVNNRPASIVQAGAAAPGSGRASLESAKGGAARMHH